MIGSHTNDTTPRADGHDAARDLHGEPLSAMMDGTLSDDESRFLLRRMQHDADLAGRWERWQFYGDAMRGCAGRALPADFNRRIALAIAAERDADGEADTRTHHALLDAVAGDPVGRAPAASQTGVRRPLLRWGGGAALAASVALAAVVGLRPDVSFGPGAVSASPDATLVDAAPSDAAEVDAAAVASGTAASGRMVAGSQAAAAADTAVVAAAAGPGDASPADAVPTARGPRPADNAPRVASAARRSGQPSPAQASPLVLAAQPADADSARRVPDFGGDFGGDFGADDVPLIAKPWPRSPLLQGRIDGGVMVDYGQGDGRGLILGRPVQAPKSGSPLLSPQRSGQQAPARGSASSDAEASAPGSGDAGADEDASAAADGPSR